MHKANKDKNHFIINPITGLTILTVKELRLKLFSLVQKNPPELTIDMCSTEVLDSTGIGLIIATYNSLKKVRGRLKIINASDVIFDLLTTLRLNKLFAIEKAS